MNLQFFVGHRKPEFPIWRGFEYFELPLPPDNVSQEECLLRDHRLMGEYASLFQLCNQLSNSGKRTGQITISQYRRFVLNTPLGLKSSNQPWSRVLSPSSMKDLSFTEEVLPLPGQNYLIGTGSPLPHGMLANYAGSHCTRDILQFSANAVDCGVLSNTEVFHFLSHPILIPAPSCGSFPLESFLNIMKKMETVSRSFISNGYQANKDLYQGRLLGFLLERLNSYLLLETLISEGKNMHQVMGSSTIVSESLEISRGQMATVL